MLVSYSGVAKFLHWLIALAILGMIALGYSMEHLVPRTDPFKFTLFQWHKSIGITILLLSFVRVVWRFTHPRPPLPDTMKLWEKFLADAVVVCFYVLMIGIPFIGWAVVSVSPLNIPTLLYGVVPWPHLPVLPDLKNKKELGDVLAMGHGYLAYSVLGLLCLHVGGALKHHFVTRDDVLLRMAPNFVHRFLNFLRGQ
jgi:cytochrome b561